jgi:hypothetical protein
MAKDIKFTSRYSNHSIKIEKIFENIRIVTYQQDNIKQTFEIDLETAEELWLELQKQIWKVKKYIQEKEVKNG